MSSETPSQLTTLILCDLPSEITESDIKSFLSSYEESIVSINKFEQKPEKVKVSFKDFDIANKCRIDLNQKKLKNKIVRIMREEKDFLNKNKNNKNNLYIKAIPHDKTAREVFEYFLKFGDIFSFKLNLDEKGNNNGTAFLTYYQETDAKKSMDETNGKKIWQSDMEVQYKNNINEKGYNNYNNYNNYNHNNYNYNNSYSQKKNLKININNLPDNYTEKEIAKLCEEFGKFEICDIKQGQKGKYTVVKFTTETEAKNAIEKLNNKEIENKKLFVKEYQYKHHHKYNNNYNNYNNYNNFYKRNNYAQNFLYQNININNINIPMALPKFEEQIENNNLYIKNIPFEATEEDLRKTFEAFGKITSIKLEEDTTIKQDTKENDKKKFINKSFGYISFDKIEEAKKALEELQGKQLKGFETWFKPLIIEYFIPKIKRQNFNFPNFTPPPLMYPSVMIPMPTPMNPMNNFKIRNQPNFRGRKNFFRGRGQFKGNKNFYTRKNNNNTNNNNNLNEKEKTIKFDYDNFNKIKTDEEKKDFLGEKLYELISENQLIKTKKANEEIIGKITGMIMDIPNEEIIEILKKPKLLDSRIEEALKLIESNQ